MLIEFNETQAKAQIEMLTEKVVNQDYTIYSLECSIKAKDEEIERLNGLLTPTTKASDNE